MARKWEATYQNGYSKSLVGAVSPWILRVGHFKSGKSMLTKCDSHGYPIGWIQRQQLLQILFSHLREKEKVLPGKRFLKSTPDSQGVTAHCTDGSSFRGNILVGADGVHSAVRKDMWRQMRELGLGKEIAKDTQGKTFQSSLLFFSMNLTDR